MPAFDGRMNKFCIDDSGQINKNSAKKQSPRRRQAFIRLDGMLLKTPVAYEGFASPS